MSLLEVRGLTRGFGGVQALQGMNLTIERGRITGLIGPNGAGKSTLFNCISGVVRPDAGEVRFAGHDITGWRADRVTRAGLVRTFQIARGFPRLSLLDNLVLYGPRQPGERVLHASVRSRRSRQREAALREQARAVAERLRLTRLLERPAGELSGGQKKLLEIGRALMAEPRLLLLDEPVAGVNPALAAEIASHLRGLLADGISVLLIEHHMDTIAALCDPVIVMAEGRHLREGSFAALADDPLVQQAYMGRRR